MYKHLYTILEEFSSKPKSRIVNVNKEIETDCCEKKVSRKSRCGFRIRGLSDQHA